MKTNCSPKIYAVFFLVILNLSAFSQRMDSLLKKLDAEYKQEKIYLQFDRSVYSPGETIWIKSYLFTGNYPSMISKTIYAELVDNTGKVLQHKSAPLLVSSAAITFDVPADYRSSVAYVRAYTKWMLNFDSGYLYSKAITIAAPLQLNPKKSTPAITKSTAPNLVPRQSYLQFFPEGGDLAEGIESRVAFKATDSRGMPVNVSGDIIDRAGKKIISFVSSHDGMGVFQLQPQPGMQYKAIWKNTAGQITETLLPTAKPNSLSLEINNYNTQVEFKIKRLATVSLYQFVYVVAQMNNQLVYKAKANIFKNEVTSAVIPIDNLPPGIMQVTLFSPDEKPLAERIVFINQFTISFITDLNIALKDAGQKKKNVLQIDVPDSLNCNLSIAVTDADLNPLQDNDNIFSHLLLTADVKGYIHNPAYYFSGDADSLADHLDLVMMTNGWRRFKWEDIIASRWPKILYKPDNYLAIEGQVQGLNKTLLANKDINGIIELKNKKKEFIVTPVKPNGSFIFTDMVFYDTAKLYYQFNNDKQRSLTSRASFDIKNNLLQQNLRLKTDSTVLLSQLKPDSATIVKNVEIYKELLNESELQKLKTLKTVVITARQKSKQEIMNEEYTSGLFSGGDARTFIADDDPAFLSSQSVLDYLRSRVAGLQISTGANPSVTWRGSPTSFFMNELDIDISAIADIPMSDIAMVKIFSPPFFGAFGGGAGGAIAVYLKKGATGSRATRGLDFVTISGYSPVKQFYSPDYSTNDNLYLTDLRKTLYWNPFVLTDKNHRRILLPFYNNDITKKMRIIIEGCNEDGKLTRVEKIIQ